MIQFKLGKRPARPLDQRALLFGDYFRAPALPTVPVRFGSPELVQSWGMLANDRYGDCVFAGAAHETMMLRAASGYGVPPFTNDAVLSDYSEVTGFSLSDPDGTDQGTDMQVAASYRQKTGIIDASGTRHMIGPYTALRVRDTSQIALATFILGVVGLGVELPETAMSQFHALEPWDVVPGSDTVGGHYVPCVGRNRHGNFLVVTWGRLQAVTPEFIVTYMDEGLAFVSNERLNKMDLSPQGYDKAALMADYHAVTS